jgi:hypothetical protein
LKTKIILLFYVMDGTGGGLELNPPKRNGDDGVGDGVEDVGVVVVAGENKFGVGIGRVLFV